MNDLVIEVSPFLAQRDQQNGARSAVRPSRWTVLTRLLHNAEKVKRVLAAIRFWRMFKAG